MEQKRAISFPLRLCTSVRQRATELSQADGISLNHFISLAVAEKISRVEHAAWLRQQTENVVPPRTFRSRLVDAKMGQAKFY